MENFKQRGRIFFAVLLILSVTLTATGVQQASAGSSYTISGCGKYGGWKYKFTKVSFSGNKVTFKGKFLKEKNGGGKSVVKKLTVPIHSLCVFGSEGDDGFYPISKAKAIKQYKKRDFLILTVTIRNGKAVMFSNGA